MSRCNFWTEIRPLRRQIESPKRRFWPLIKEVRKGGGGWKMGKEKKKNGGGGGGSASSSMFAEDKFGGCFLEEREESFCVFSL
jgi:hypothetical protein